MILDSAAPPADYVLDNSSVHDTFICFLGDEGELRLDIPLPDLTSRLWEALVIHWDALPDPRTVILT
jgi:hypothetical protein